MSLVSLKRFALAAILSITPLGLFAADLNSDVHQAAMSKLNVTFPAPVEQTLALSAAPVHLRTDATVYVFGNQGYVISRRGSNGFTCLVNRDAFFYRAAQFKPTCWDSQGADTYVPVMLLTGEMLAQGKTFEQITAAIDKGFDEQKFHAPNGGGVAYMLAGDIDLDATGHIVKQVFPGHYMFYANNITNKQLGYSREAAKQDPTLPFVVSEGVGADHGLKYLIAVPGDAHRHAAE